LNNTAIKIRLLLL